MSIAVALAATACLTAMLAGALVNLQPRPPQYSIQPDPALMRVKDVDGAVSRFTGLLQHASTSNAEVDLGMDDPEPFAKQLDYLAAAYPTVWSTLKVERVNMYSLLFTWRGSNPTLDPLMYISHLDVVPVAGNWTHPAFGGVVADGYIWGRGTIDVKISVAAALEATEQLISAGYQPERTLLMAFGHDEEIGGSRGAAKINDLLQSRGIKPWMTLDEGGFVLKNGFLPSYAKQAPLALVGISEKGGVTVDVSLSATGGHSSVPPPPDKQVAVTISKLIVQTAQDQPSTKFTVPVAEMLKTIAHLMPFPMNALLQMVDVPYVGNVLARVISVVSPKLSPMLHTSCVCVDLAAGIGAENVVPPQAKASFNFRLLPGDTVDTVLSFLRQKLGAATQCATLATTAQGAVLAAPVTDIKGQQWELLQQTILQTFKQPHPDLVVTPYLTVGGTDSKHYPMAEDRRFRFLPLAISYEEASLLHGIDERVSVDSYKRAVEFFMRMTINGCGKGVSAETE